MNDSLNNDRDTRLNTYNIKVIFIIILRHQLRISRAHRHVHHHRHSHHHHFDVIGVVCGLYNLFSVAVHHVQAGDRYSAIFIIIFHVYHSCSRSSLPQGTVLPGFFY